MGGVIAQVDTGITPYTWGVDPDDNVFTRRNGNWKKIPGKLIHVSVGEAGVWGVNRGNQIFFRNNINPRNPNGRSWRRVPGGLKQIDSGPNSIVCGVNKADDIYCRIGITAAIPYGRSWVRVPGKLKYISCGVLGHWGVNKNNDIFFRYGVSPVKPQGTKWKHVPGKLHQIESGPDGAVWGVNIISGVFTRIGVSQANPVGKKWKGFTKKKLTIISVGPGTLVAVDRKGKPLSGEASSFVGPNGLPKKPAGIYVVKCPWKIQCTIVIEVHGIIFYILENLLDTFPSISNLLQENTV